MNTSSTPGFAAKFDIYWRLMRFHRPIGIYLLLWPTLWGLWFAAGGLPPLKLLVVFVLGTVLMRAAGCVINDFADRDFDPQVARTRDRPLAAGEIGSGEALRLFVVVALIGFVSTFRLLRSQRGVQVGAADALTGAVATQSIRAAGGEPDQSHHGGHAGQRGGDRNGG